MLQICIAAEIEIFRPIASALNLQLILHFNNNTMQQN